MKLTCFKKHILWFGFFFLYLPLKATDNKKISNSEHEINIFTGLFDFSDDGKRSQKQFQHQNLLESFRYSFTNYRALITQDSASYFTGVQAMYKVGSINQRQFHTWSL